MSKLNDLNAVVETWREMDGVERFEFVEQLNEFEGLYLELYLTVEGVVDNAKEVMESIYYAMHRLGVDWKLEKEKND